MKQRIKEGLPLAATVFVIVLVAAAFLCALGNYAYAADRWADGVKQTDYSTSVASGITAADTTRWDTASGSITNTLSDVMANGNVTETNILVTAGKTIFLKSDSSSFIEWNNSGLPDGPEKFKIYASDLLSSNGFYFTETGGPLTTLHAARFTSGTNQASMSTTADTVKINDGNLEIVSTNNFTYFGPPAADGSWRQGISSNNFVHERRESGVWVTKDVMTP